MTFETYLKEALSKGTAKLILDVGFTPDGSHIRLIIGSVDNLPPKEFTVFDNHIFDGSQ